MRFFLKPRSDRSLPFIMFISFLGVFLVSRLIVFYFPEFYASKYVSGNSLHVHHFAYGIVLMSILGVISIMSNLSTKARQVMAILFGMAMGMAYDEFAMWLQLDDVYHDRMTYDAIMTISLLFINLIYFDGFWKTWGRRLWRLPRIILRALY